MSTPEGTRAVCKKCRLPIVRVQGVWVVDDPRSTADGLSYCPPNPDAAKVGNHWMGR